MTLLITKDAPDLKEHGQALQTLPKYIVHVSSTPNFTIYTYTILDVIKMHPSD